MSEHQSHHNRRIRLIYSMKDFQLALSAADFLQECDPDESINKVQLRRYKCFETTAIVAYSRPFSESRGSVPRLSMKMIGVRLDEQQQALHDEIIQLRNRVIAHSDAAMMRMVARIAHVNIGNAERMPYIDAVFDEGLSFVGFFRVSQMLALFHTVFDGLYTTLLEDVRNNPEGFDISHDYLELDGN